jgi:hypothetical protein
MVLILLEKSKRKMGPGNYSFRRSMVDFKKFIARLKENNLYGPFFIHCGCVPDKDDLRSKAAKMKKNLTAFRGGLKEPGL